MESLLEYMGIVEYGVAWVAQSMEYGRTCFMGYGVHVWGNMELERSLYWSLQQDCSENLQVYRTPLTSLQGECARKCEVWEEGVGVLHTCCG